MLNLQIDTTDYTPRTKELIKDIQNNPRHLGIEVKKDIDDLLHMVVVEEEHHLGKASILPFKRK